MANLPGVSPVEKEAQTPERSLHVRYVIREKLFRLGEDSTIKDDSGQPVYQVDGKVLTIHHRMEMTDLHGNRVATITKRLVALTPTFTIERPGKPDAEMHKRFLSLFGDRFVVDVPGEESMTVNGNILDHNYQVERNGQAIASVSKHWVSLTDTYGIEIAPGEDDALILACVLALDVSEDEERE
jgi:uncharacterized protein YxjI